MSSESSLDIMKQSETDVSEQSAGTRVGEDNVDEAMQQHGNDEHFKLERKLGISSCDSQKVAPVWVDVVQVFSVV